VNDAAPISLQQAYADHSRHWRDFLYCYPVISRRSKGLSIGINLNPDKACNFDCIYCQVDRKAPPSVRKVDLDVLRAELAHLLDAAALLDAPTHDASRRPAPTLPAPEGRRNVAPGVSPGFTTENTVKPRRGDRDSHARVNPASTMTAPPQLAHDPPIVAWLFAETPFNAILPDQRVVRDIAFSGDGEPTSYPRFDDAVSLVADLKRERRLDDTKIVLITDACYLTKPHVAAGLRFMDENNGEIWAKLDAGTQGYYELVNRPNFPLAHVLSQILETAKIRPIVIQSLWMRVHSQPPPDEEVREFAKRLNELLAAGAQFKLIQIYTVARQTTETYATPLSRTELDRVANIVTTAITVPIETYHGIES